MRSVQMPSMPCAVCTKVYPPGTSHDCLYPETVMAHDQVVVQAERAAQREAFREIADELGYAPKTEERP